MAYYNQLPNYAGTTSTGNVTAPSAQGPTSHVAGILPGVFGGKAQVASRWDFPYSQLSSLLPTLPATNAQLGQNTLQEAQGRLSPEQIRNTQDAMARFGQSSGMPGSELGTNLGANSAGQETSQIQHQGLQDYTSLIPTIFKTQMVDPDMQIKLAMWNATNASKADPAIGGIGSILGDVGM